MKVILLKSTHNPATLITVYITFLYRSRLVTFPVSLDSRERTFKIDFQKEIVTTLYSQTKVKRYPSWCHVKV